LRLVVDTNVLISALISSQSLTGHVVELWREGRFNLLTLAEELDELDHALGHHRAYGGGGSAKALRPCCMKVVISLFSRSRSAMASIFPTLSKRILISSALSRNLSSRVRRKALFALSNAMAQSIDRAPRATSRSVSSNTARSLMVSRACSSFFLNRASSYPLEKVFAAR